jgi:hypothetical protein
VMMASDATSGNQKACESKPNTVRIVAAGTSMERP